MVNSTSTRGIRNNNPLNIEFSQHNSWEGARRPRTDTRFEEFTSLEYGLRAGFLILKKYLARPPLGHGCRTLADIIRKWAPATENPTSEYIKFVAYRSGIPATEQLKFSDKNQLCRIVQAMCLYESREEVSFGRIENAYALALR